MPNQNFKLDRHNTNANDDNKILKDFSSYDVKVVMDFYKILFWFFTCFYRNKTTYLLLKKDYQNRQQVTFKSERKRTIDIEHNLYTG